MTALKPCLRWGLPASAAVGAAWAAYALWRVPLPDTPAPLAPASTVSAPATLSPQVLARLFDLPSDAPIAQARTPLKLKASVVAGRDSRILVEHAGRVQAYRLGDKLPDGSHVRQVNTYGAVLWQQGEDVLLPLGQARSSHSYLEAVERPPAPGTRRFLRAAPLSDTQS